MNLAVLELLTALPDGVVSSAEVNEEVPGPVSHLQEIPHALQVGGQEAGPAPDGGHSPGGDSDIVVLPGELEYLPMQVIGTLFPGDKGRKGTVNSPKTSAHRHPSHPVPLVVVVSDHTGCYSWQPVVSFCIDVQIFHSYEFFHWLLKFRFRRPIAELVGPGA